MGLFSSSSKQSQSVTDTSAGASVGGNATAPVTSVSLNAGSSTAGTFNFTDPGAIAAGSGIANRSFDFAGVNSEKSFEFVSNAFDRALDRIGTTQDAANNAFQQSISAVSAAREPADEKTRQQFTYLALGVLVLLAVVFYKGGH